MQSSEIRHPSDKISGLERHLPNKSVRYHSENGRLLTPTYKPSPGGWALHELLMVPSLTVLALLSG